MRSSMLTALSFFTAITSAHATTVIAIAEKQFFAFATDSRQTNIDKSEVRNVCKIGHTKNIFWAQAGLVNVGGIPVQQIAARIMSDDTMSYSDKMSRFISEVKAPLAINLAQLKSVTADAIFKKYFVTGPPLVVAFGKFENGSPTVHVLQFKAHWDPQVRIIENTITFSAAEPNISVFGASNPIVPYIRATPGVEALLKNPKTVAEAIKLFPLEYKAYPDDVGPPVAMVVVQKDGPHWIAKGHCT